MSIIEARLQPMQWPTYQPLGDQGVLIFYENRIDPHVVEKVWRLAGAIEKANPPWLVDVVFSFRCVLAIYDPRRIRFPDVVTFLQGVEADTPPLPAGRRDLYEIPTVYGGSQGPDLDRVSEVSGCSPEEVIAQFSSTVFTVYFLGFLCAQPYLGGLPGALHVPRQASPRLHIPAGSVGIGGVQASLITIDQPSGHNFIGRTYLSLYDPARLSPPCIRAGDRIIFPAVSEDRIEEFKGKIPSPVRQDGHFGS